MNDPMTCSTWYEDPYGYMWSTDSKSMALMKWTEISGRPMEFEADTNFRYSVTASDGYTYYFWGWVMSEDYWHYYISVYKPKEDMSIIDL